MVPSSVVAVQLRLSERAFSYLSLVINTSHLTFPTSWFDFCFLFLGWRVQGRLPGKSDEIGLQVEAAVSGCGETSIYYS